MAATVSIAVLSALLDAVPQLSAIHSALLTDHYLDQRHRPHPLTAIHLAYAAIFLSLAYLRVAPGIGADGGEHW